MLFRSHDTIATFRRRFLKQLEALFLQVLELAKEMKLLKLGTVCLDGTKIHANASRHSALSNGHIEKLEVQLKAEVGELFALALVSRSGHRPRWGEPARGDQTPRGPARGDGRCQDQDCRTGC